ncbi:hypothetical protein ACL9RF_09325 [Sphingobacterium sp. Mn56C]|uniref:hypothetical protein n=1 Tax=Sphingobacterium sp. Mn56C TaxID=3395261 RepID=UPI003BC2F30A
MYYIRFNSFLLGLLVMLFLACNPQPKAVVVDNEIEDSVVVQEPAPKDAIYDSLGDLLSEIKINLKANAEQQKDFVDGNIPWISIAHPQKEIAQLKDPDEVVISDKKVTLVVDYPLNTPAILELSSETGFTRKSLIEEISKHYHEIYRIEEETATTKTVPIDQRTGLTNRNHTDGKYGIYGHDLVDLELSAIEVYKNKEGKTILLLVVES